MCRLLRFRERSDSVRTSVGHLKLSLPEQTRVSVAGALATNYPFRPMLDGACGGPNGRAWQSATVARAFSPSPPTDDSVLPMERGDDGRLRRILLRKTVRSGQSPSLWAWTFRRRFEKPNRRLQGSPVDPASVQIFGSSQYYLAWSRPARYHMFSSCFFPCAVDVNGSPSFTK